MLRVQVRAKRHPEPLAMGFKDYLPTILRTMQVPASSAVHISMIEDMLPNIQNKAGAEAFKPRHRSPLTVTCRKELLIAVDINAQGCSSKCLLTRMLSNAAPSTHKSRTFALRTDHTTVNSNPINSFTTQINHLPAPSDPP